MNRAVSPQEARLAQLESRRATAKTQAELEAVRKGLLELQLAAPKPLHERIKTTLSLIKHQLAAVRSQAFERAFVSIARERLSGQLFEEIFAAALADARSEPLTAAAVTRSLDGRAIERAAVSVPMRFDPTPLFREFGREFVIEFWRSLPAEERATTGSGFRNQLLAARPPKGRKSYG
jgi:hypothetical protein